jgi:LysM repeat protein
MAARTRARYLAPIALTATIAATYFVVHNGVAIKPKPPVAQASQQRDSPKHQFAHVKMYTIQPGETLTSISVKTGISLATLESLNPNINPDSLQAGQKLRLRR